MKKNLFCLDNQNIFIVALAQIGVDMIMNVCLFVNKLTGNVCIMGIKKAKKDLQFWQVFHNHDIIMIMRQ